MHKIERISLWVLLVLVIFFLFFKQTTSGFTIASNNISSLAELEGLDPEIKSMYAMYMTPISKAYTDKANSEWKSLPRQQKDDIVANMNLFSKEMVKNINAAPSASVAAHPDTHAETISKITNTVTAPGMGGAAPIMGGAAPGMGGTAPGMGGTAPGMGGTAPVSVNNVTSSDFFMSLVGHACRNAIGVGEFSKGSPIPRVSLESCKTTCRTDNTCHGISYMDNSGGAGTAGDCWVYTGLGPYTFPGKPNETCYSYPGGHSLGEPVKAATVSAPPVNKVATVSSPVACLTSGKMHMEPGPPCCSNRMIGNTHVCA